MKIDFNVTGTERKELANFIGDALETKPKYLGVPSFAYQIGDFMVTRDGGLLYDDSIDATNLIKAIREAGYSAEIEETGTAVPVEETNEELPEPEVDGLTIGMPRSFFTDSALENLKKLVESKASLIKAAFEIDELPIIVDEEKVEFPWFSEPDAETSAAAIVFISKLSEMAKNAARVTAIDKEVENPKYAMRCFLLRLGFIGAEYKDVRKTLLKNLSGNSSWKNGKKEAADDEVTE